MAERRYPGLAHGWEGSAWIDVESIAAPTLARLLARAAGESSTGPAALLGDGGAAQVAVLAAARDRRFAPIAARLVARWADSDCEASKDDVMEGHPGALIALAELAPVPGFAPPRRFVQRCQARTRAALRRTTAMGMAHGLAGLLLAAELGAARLGLRRDVDAIEDAFARLAAARVHMPGVGTVWHSPSGAITTAWCHGSTGIALALHGAWLASGEYAYLELFDEVAPGLTGLRSLDQTLCCGRAGRVATLRELHRRTGEMRWQTAAAAVAAAPAGRRSLRQCPRGLMQGARGLAADARLPATGCWS